MSTGRTSVLFLIPTMAGGGAERFISILLRHLDRNLFEPHLGLLQAQGEYMEHIPADVVVHDLKVSRARYVLPAFIKLARKLRPHAVLSTLPAVNMALILSKPFLPSGTRVLISEVAFTSAILEQEIRHPQLWRWLYRRLYKRADRIVCLCDSMVDDLASHFNVPRRKLLRIYYPVDAKRVREQAESGENPYHGPGPHLVAAGRLCRQKGFDVLLAAMPAVLQRFPHARLLILGQGPLREELASQARTLGITEAVELAGFQQNPWRYFRHGDLFILPSRYEGLPNVLLEALAVGARVVAADCPGAMREVQACSRRMVLVPPENQEALAEAIIAACCQSEFGHKSPDPGQQDLSNFDLQRVVDQYSALLLS